MKLEERCDWKNTQLAIKQEVPKDKINQTLYGIFWEDCIACKGYNKKCVNYEKQQRRYQKVEKVMKDGLA